MLSSTWRSSGRCRLPSSALFLISSMRLLSSWWWSQGGGVEGQEGGSGDDSFWLVLSGAAALFQGWTTGHVSQPPSSNRTPGSACTHPAAVRHGGGLPHAAQQGGELCAEGSGRGGSPGAGALGEEQW